MNRLFVVGDVHGCLQELEALLDALSVTPEDRIVFLGDYVDRGDDSKGVIERLTTLATTVPTVFLKGNHEDMLLDWLGEGGRHGDAFLWNGGEATLRSYGLGPEATPEQAIARIPAQHLEFYRNLELMHRMDPFLCVHAGIHPLAGLERQSTEDVLWIREEFIRNRHRLPLTVLFGHTPMRDVFWNLPYKIGLDTGCVFGGRLSCLELREGVLVQVRRGNRRAETRTAGPELAALRRLSGEGFPPSQS